MSPMNDVAGSLDRYLAEFERAEAARAEPAWLTRARHHGMDRFQSLGFPTTDDEEWRFTSVAPIVEANFEPARDGLVAL